MRTIEEAQCGHIRDYNNSKIIRKNVKSEIKIIANIVN